MAAMDGLVFKLKADSKNNQASKKRRKKKLLQMIPEKAKIPSRKDMLQNSHLYSWGPNSESIINNPKNTKTKPKINKTNKWIKKERKKERKKEEKSERKMERKQNNT